MMNQEIEKYLKNLTLDYFSCHKMGSDFEKVFSIYKKIQSNISALIDKQDDVGITGLKVITVMTFSILKKIGEGKQPANFDKQDWMQIIDDISQYAVLQDGMRAVGHHCAFW